MLLCSLRGCPALAGFGAAAAGGGTDTAPLTAPRGSQLPPGRALPEELHVDPSLRSTFLPEKRGTSLQLQEQQTMAC